MTGKLILKSLNSPEVSLETWKPKSNIDIYVTLDIEIGFENRTIERGENKIEDVNDLFLATLATPESLIKNRSGPILLLNRTIVVSEYNFDDIWNAVMQIVEESSRSTWEESCIVLGRYFQWEYEDHTVVKW